MVARIVRDDEVGGSNPLAPTIPNSHVEPVWDRCGKAVCHGAVGETDGSLPRAEHFDTLEQGFGEYPATRTTIGSLARRRQLS